MRSNSAKQGDQASWGLKLAAWGGLVFLHFPIVIICLYAFNTEDAAFSFIVSADAFAIARLTDEGILFEKRCARRVSAHCLRAQPSPSFT